MLTDPSDMAAQNGWCVIGMTACSELVQGLRAGAGSLNYLCFAERIIFTCLCQL
jgi:hypothetical protein